MKGRCGPAMPLGSLHQRLHAYWLAVRRLPCLEAHSYQVSCTLPSLAMHPLTTGRSNLMSLQYSDSMVTVLPIIDVPLLYAVFKACLKMTYEDF